MSDLRLPFCGHTDFPPAGNDYRDGECRVCWLFVNSEEYQEYFSGLATNPPNVGICRHLLTVIDRRDSLCQGCWTMGCAVLGECTRFVRHANLPMCGECRHHQLDDAEEDRPR